jgi:23S rRNA (guanosine2251-2'-O)-methyltransferase
MSKNKFSKSGGSQGGSRGGSRTGSGGGANKANRRGGRPSSAAGSQAGRSKGGSQDRFGGRASRAGEGASPIEASEPRMIVPRPGGGASSAPRTKAGSAFMISGRERLSLGIHSVREAIKVRPHAIKRLGLRDDYPRAPQLKELAELAEANSIEIQTLTGSDLDGIGSGHQGVAAVITESPKLDLEALKAMEKCVLVACDGLEDPMNLGSILRSAWLLGASGVLLPQDRSVSVTTATVKVASGGAEHVPVEICSNLPRELELFREAGFWVFGLAEKGKGVPWDFKLPEKVIWVVGSESSGLRVTVERACDELVRLPQIPGGSSYNAAVATAMALYESVRQNGLPGTPKN